MIERFRAIFLLAGVGCFAFAFVVMGWLPWSMLRKQPVRTVEELAATVPPEFEDLAARYPIPFREAFGSVDPASYAKAIRRGKVSPSLSANQVEIAAS